MPKETRLSFRPTSVLLDKGVVRRTYESRVRAVLGKPPTPLQAEAANVYARLLAAGIRPSITEQTAHILALRPPVLAGVLLQQTQTLRKARYLRRWARRLRDFGFSPEDAVIIAYGSFGLALDTGQVGVEVIITNDHHLATNYRTRYAEINERFEAMVNSLAEPYQSLKLPHIITMTEALATL